jgi:ATP-binding cassette subfamily B multidrug efflux pump
MKELLALTPFLRKHAVLIVAGLALVIVANALSLASPWLIKEAIDSLEGPGADRSVLARYAVLIVIAALLGGAARFGMRMLLNGVSRHVEFDLRNRLFEHLLRLDAGFYGAMPTGELMSRATNDIAAVRMVAGPAYMYLANTVFVSLFAISLMLWIDARLTVIAMIPMLALPPITVGFGNLIHRRFESIQERFGAMSTMVQENLAGIRIVRAYRQEERQIARFERVATEYQDGNIALARISGLFHPTLGLLSGLAMALVLLLGGRAVMAGSISVGDFVAFLLYLGMLTWPMIALGWVVNLFQRGAASMRRINLILDAKPAITDDHADPSAIIRRGEIEFRNVSFRFPGNEREVLHDISFRIGAGESLGIVGATGSGKTALVSLIPRIHDPTAGEILIDGIPLPRIPLARLRAAVGVVPQDAFLFSETIRDNLAFGLEGVEDPEVRVVGAARVAELDRTIREFPDGYDTMLGERGVNLSGGQKQRASIARTLARDPLVVILDDALSAVDTHTETEILRGLRDALRDRTSIIVSHRVSAVIDADQIIVIDDGRIVERGTHDELLRLDGHYAALLHRQLLRQEVEGEGEGVLAGPNKGN